MNLVLADGFQAYIACVAGHVVDCEVSTTYRHPVLPSLECIFVFLEMVVRKRQCSHHQFLLLCKGVDCVSCSWEFAYSPLFISLTMNLSNGWAVRVLEVVIRQLHPVWSL